MTKGKTVTHKPHDPSRKMGGFSDPDWGCRRHPNHKQLPGVCSVCLSDSLMKLTTVADDPDHTTACYSSLSSSPPYSSASSFSPAVAPKAAEPKQTFARPQYRRRNGSDDHVTVPLDFLLNKGNGNGEGGMGFKKSRSVGCGPRIYRGVNGNMTGNGDVREKKEKKANAGFWKKLIHSTSKKTKGVLMHSTTMKQRSNDNTNSSSSSRKLR